MQNTDCTECEETHDEIVGMLIAISIVTKRLAKRLSDLGKPDAPTGNENREQTNEKE